MTNLDTNAEPSQRARQLAAIVDEVAEKFVAIAPDLRRTILHIIWHESNRASTRYQSEGPARGLPQFQANRAKDEVLLALRRSPGALLACSAPWQLAAIEEAANQLHGAAFPHNNLIEALLLRDDFAVLLMALALNRSTVAVPADAAEDYGYWLEVWNRGPDSEAKEKRFKEHQADFDKQVTT